MKDFFNQELAVGDEVAILLPAYRNLVNAKIIKLTEQKIRVEYIHQNDLRETVLCPDLCIKKPFEEFGYDYYGKVVKVGDTISFRREPTRFAKVTKIWRDGEFVTFDDINNVTDDCEIKEVIKL